MKKNDAADIEDSIGVGLDHRTIRASMIFADVPKENPQEGPAQGSWKELGARGSQDL